MSQDNKINLEKERRQLRLVKTQFKLVDFCEKVLESPELAGRLATRQFESYLPMFQAVSKCYVGVPNQAESIIDFLKNMGRAHGFEFNDISLTEQQQQDVVDMVEELNKI